MYCWRSGREKRFDLVLAVAAISSLMAVSAEYREAFSDKQRHPVKAGTDWQCARQSLQRQLEARDGARVISAVWCKPKGTKELTFSSAEA